ncbi:origin recognition complex subunit 3 N-terminus-domain-containing protein [Lentinula detonsa]|uniref:Origin recognition complex subunit 3 N-terminus-domain-containing protein n=1 Tax=Lentinula detonsa TaxID=2804962 RepID=A0AA38UVX9_9AGAR|nr:origin recognition complex subunit 3 N-terminus-domain-containing protein [Lentinula detonsa]
MVDLNEADETVLYIPFKGDQQDAKPLEPLAPPNLPFDLPNGPELRWDAYKAAWSKCSNQIQTLLHQLYEPVVAEVVEKIELAYSGGYDNDIPLLALPYAEIPTIAVANPTSDAYFLSSIVSQLHLITHLYPSDCVNLTTAMKAIVNGFLFASHPASTFRSSAKTLATYDISVLLAWYLAQEPETKPRRLILLLHDFEQFDPGVVQDMFYICSQHVPALPLILLISLSSPQSPSSPHSYLHVTYPLATLKLLRIQSVVVPSGPRILEEVVIKTFVNLPSDVDLNDKLDIVLGPAVLEYLTEYATQFNHSVPALLNILQLAHLKHFLTNPLTALVSLVHHVPLTTSDASALNTTLRNPASAAFRNVLIHRLDFCGSDSDDTNFDLDSSLPALIRALHAAHIQFRSRSHAIRLALSLLQGFHEFLVERGYKGLGTHWGSGDSTTTPVHTTSSALSFRYPQYSRLQNYINLLQLHTQTHPRPNQAAKDITYTRTLLRKLKPEELRAYLDVLIAYLEGMPNGLADNLGIDGEDQGDKDDGNDGPKSLSLTEAIQMLEGWRVEADEAYGTYEAVEMELDMNGDGAEKFRMMNEDLAEWMYNYLRTLTQPIENTPLWDVWYTGSEVFPSETLNPSIRASIVAGLLRPEDFAAPAEPAIAGSASHVRSQEEHKTDRTWVIGRVNTQKEDLNEHGSNFQNVGSSDSESEDGFPIHTLPDISILFHRYLESGKMINVYDWFESFHAVLNVQRREAKAKIPNEGEKSGRKRKGKAAVKNVSMEKKGKGKEKESPNEKGKGNERAKNLNSDLNEDEDMDAQDNPDSDSEEHQQILIQARFIRALHELDFLGFIKHTRRRPDHVLRTVFEVGD